jgi:hypothetical protein
VRSFVQKARAAMRQEVPEHTTSKFIKILHGESVALRQPMYSDKSRKHP